MQFKIQSTKRNPFNISYWFYIWLSIHNQKASKRIWRPEKYITFSVPIKKELDNGKTVTCKLKFVDSFRFMSTSLSSLVDKFSEIYSKKCRDKNCESECDFTGIQNKKLYYKCDKCKNEQLRPINGLSKKFLNKCEFCYGDINNFILLLRKGVFSYEYMDSWERFEEASLPDKKSFYSI